MPNPAQTEPISTPDPLHLDVPITKRNVFAAFIETGHALSMQLGAWEHFGSQVVAFLKEHDLAEAFGEYQAKQRAALRKRAAAAVNSKRRARR